MYTEELIDADFKTAPYVHQMKEFEISVGAQSRALLWSMRTGKSKLLIDTACSLFTQGKIDAVLLFAPNGIHDNWIRRELPFHHWDNVERDTIVWRTDDAGTKGINRVLVSQREGWHERRKDFWEHAKQMMTTPKLAWFAFNSQSMTRKDVRNFVARVVRNRKVMIIFDESDEWRTPGATRTKMARAMALRCPYRRIATASVITNSPLAAFSQYELLAKEALGHRVYGTFKERYAVYKTQTNRRGQSYPVLDTYQNLEELRENMAQWSSVVLRKDILDMPDLVLDTMDIELTPEQKKLYRELHTQFTFDIGGKEVSVRENTHRLTKLQQVCSGFLKDEFGDIYTIPGGNPRLEALADEVYLSSGKVIIWCRFQYDIDLVVERLMGDGHEIVQYHGRVSDTDKIDALDRLRSDSRVKALVGQPQAGGRGQEMAAADLIIWYSHVFDAIVREQADERATAIGGGNVRVCNFVAPGVDGYMLDNQIRKFKIAEDIARSGMQYILNRIKI